MKEMDPVQVIVEKEKYAKEGIHKGMYGWICYDKCVRGYWLVNFPQCGEKEDIATTSTRLLRPWDSPGTNTGVGCHLNSYT